MQLRSLSIVNSLLFLSVSLVYVSYNQRNVACVIGVISATTLETGRNLHSVEDFDKQMVRQQVLPELFWSCSMKTGLK